MITFKEIIVELTEKSNDKDYDKFFRAKLKKWGIKSPSELSKEDQKKFYDEVDRDWEAKKETD